VKTINTPEQDPKLTEAERVLVERYPLVNIVAETLRLGEGKGFGSKRVVTIKCGNCNVERTLATSDLFHVRYCEACANHAKKEAKKAKVISWCYNKPHAPLLGRGIPSRQEMNHDG
jgi:hypothetical protein